jgi:hypothetical protein
VTVEAPTTGDGVLVDKRFTHQQSDEVPSWTKPWTSGAAEPRSSGGPETRLVGNRASTVPWSGRQAGRRQ